MSFHDSRRALSVLRSKHVNRGYEPLSYQVDSASRASIEDLFSFYNPTGGPVRKLASNLSPGGAFRVNVGQSGASNLDLLIQKLTGLPSLEPGIRDTLWGGGKGMSLNDMLLSTLGEAVERSVGALPYFLDVAVPLWGSRRDLVERGFTCLSPQECPLFAVEQYADRAFYYEPFTDDSPLSWIEGRRLLSEERVLVPAQLIDLLHLGHPSEAPIGYGHSGGLSCHISREHALFHAITELLERHALNVRWYLGIPPDEITLDAIRNPELRALVHDLDRQPGEMRYLQHSLDIPEIPVVTAIRYDDWLRTFAYTAGGGVDTDIEIALVKALGEFGQSERMIKFALMAPERAVAFAVEEAFGVAADAPLEMLTTFVQVIGLYGHRANRPKLDWYLSDNPARALSELPRNRETDMAIRLTQLEAILARHGIDPIVFDFSPPDCDQLALFKVFAPQITQSFLQSKPMLGHPLFAEIAARYGGKPDFCFEDFTPDPLPFP